MTMLLVFSSTPTVYYLPMDNPLQIIQLLESVGADLVNAYISEVSL